MTITNECLSAIYKNYKCNIKNKDCIDYSHLKSFNYNKKPCINIKYELYHPILTSIIESDWTILNFFLIKSGLGNTYEMGVNGENNNAYNLMDHI